MQRIFTVVLACVSTLTLAGRAGAVGINVQIDEVMVGANGDSRIQFIELKMQGAGDNLWGPQGGEPEGRVRLLFVDAYGTQTGEFVFPSDPPVGVVDPINGGYSVLVATSTFAAQPGMPTPDFVIPASLLSVNGQVRFTANPDNMNAPTVNLCLSYGNYAASTGSDTLGNPAGAAAAVLPIVNARSLQRTQNFGNYGSQQYNADFAVTTAHAPRNSAGATGTISVSSLSAQGSNLFMLETFHGNGRTCHTCHRPNDKFGLSPTTIGSLPPNDPLFVAENFPALATLENPCLMRGARGLILENIDGFGNPHVFREPPHLLNLELTPPYGLSGEFPDLQTFTDGAVKQHFPKTMARNADPSMGPLDFRLPTVEEMEAIEAFMLTIKLPADGDFSIDRMINAAVARGGDAAAIDRGRTLFTNETGKCFKCHSGPVLGEADFSLGGGNQSFQTGVSQLPINTQVDVCLGTPLPLEAGGFRSFNTPGLVGVSQTAPYFHNNAVQTLREAVEFYTGTQFNASPGGVQVGGITLTSGEVDDITAFLQALIEPTPVDCNSNTTDDVLDLMNGGALDCNGNLIPDSCELAANDCNTNGIPDECDRKPLYFSLPSDFTTADGPYNITHADLDGDGDQDLISPGWIGNHVAVRLNNGFGVFSSGGTFAVESFPRVAVVADVNADTRPDVITTNLLTSNLSVLINNGPDGMGGWLGFAAVQPFSIGGNGGISAVAADFDGDGDADVAVARNFTNQFAVLMNNGNTGMTWNGFAAPVTYAVNIGSGPWSIAAGKMNADNRPDLVIAVRQSNNIGVYLNSGTGTFPTEDEYTVQNAPEVVIAAPLDADTLADIAVANTDSDTVTVLINEGAGTFNGTTYTLVVGSYPFGAQPKSMVAADAEGDGDLDLIMSNNESDNVSVLMNKGNGEMTPLVNFVVPDRPDGVTAADFDGNGAIDIVTTHFLADAGYILFNQTPPFGGDCNTNGTPDSCDISVLSAKDRNVNNIPDGCEKLGDVNEDQLINGADLNEFVAVLLKLNMDPPMVAACDINGDANANADDISPFVDILVNGP